MVFFWCKLLILNQRYGFPKSHQSPVTDFVGARREKVKRYFFAIKLKLCRRVKAVLPAYIKFGFIHALQVYQKVAFQLFSVHSRYTTIFRKLNERVIRHLFAKSTPDENWTYGNFSAIT